MSGRWLWMLAGLALVHFWGTAHFLGWAREAYLLGGWDFAFPHLIGLTYMVCFGGWAAWRVWQARKKSGDGEKP